MKVLHINCSALRDRFYMDLYSKIKENNIEQLIFTPYREKEYSKKELSWAIYNYKKTNIELCAVPIKKIYYRLFYKCKINKYKNYLIENVQLNDFSIIHAHSLYTNGGVAYEIYKKYKIPYIVAVRATDIQFMKLFPHLKSYVKKIIENASSVVFISPNLKDQTSKLLYDNFLNNINNKFIIIPNGINSFWFSQSNKHLKRQKMITILQVSRLEKRKNVDKTIKAIKRLLNRGVNCKLIIIGEGNQESKLKRLVRQLKIEQYVTFTGYIESKDKLIKYYNEADVFCMPSYGETFGISYIEAAAMGIPIIGINGTGVSGYFSNGEIGFFIDNCDPDTIANVIEKIINNYDNMSKNAKKKSKDFNWDSIVKQYIFIYDKSIRSD